MTDPTARAMNAVRQLWHLAGARHALNESRPSHDGLIPVGQPEPDGLRVSGTQVVRRLTCVC